MSDEVRKVDHFAATQRERLDRRVRELRANGVDVVARRERDKALMERDEARDERDDLRAALDALAHEARRFSTDATYTVEEDVESEFTAALETAEALLVTSDSAAAGGHKKDDTATGGEG